MEHPALRILNAHRIMSISTLRPDGWPQTTIVGYTNAGWTVYFLIYRSSQKFANIQHDDRVSIAVGSEPRDLNELAAVYAGGRASEVTDPEQREQIWKMMMERHPVLAAFVIPDRFDAVLMEMKCQYVSVLDFTQGLGHSEHLTVGGDTEAGAPAAAGAGNSSASDVR